MKCSYPPFSQAPLRDTLAFGLFLPLLLGAFIYLVIVAVLIGVRESIFWLISEFKPKPVENFKQKYVEVTHSAETSSLHKGEFKD